MARNRWYDPNTGRFTQQDPIGFAGGTNLYGYVGNNPVMFTDPFGLSPRCPPDCPFTAILSAAGAIIGAVIGGTGGGIAGGGAGAVACSPGGPAAAVCGAAGAVSGSLAGAAEGAGAGAVIGGWIGAGLDGLVTAFASKKDIGQVDDALRDALGRSPTDEERGEFGDAIHDEKSGPAGHQGDFGYRQLVELARRLFGGGS